MVISLCRPSFDALLFFRVKELGADPEAMMKGSAANLAPQNGMDMDDLRSEDSDLALLHSHNVSWVVIIAGMRGD